MIVLNSAKRWICVATVVAGLFAAQPRADAQDTPPLPECRGRDLLADYKAKQPQDYERWIAAARNVPNGEAVFWRISGKDLDRPSFLLGTAHVTDPRIVTLPPKTDDAFAKADILAVEIKDLGNRWADYFNNLFALSFEYLPGEKTWRDYMSPAEINVMQAELAQYGYSVEQFERQQPWVTALSLFAYPNCEAWRIYLGRDYLDADLANRARRMGKEVIGLETRYESARTIAQTSLEAQFDIMLAQARLPETPEDQYETGIQVYLNRLIPLYTLFELGPYQATSKEIEAFREFDRHSIDERNITMRDRALPLIRQGNAFIAVGAAHLPGDEGLVELLRKAGYEVTPVN